MNNLIMIDSSCWIKYFRYDDKMIAENVRKLIYENRACLCGIIELEILRGIKNEKQMILVQDLFSNIPFFDFQRIDFVKSGITIRELSLKGITVTSTDTLIAELCKREDIQLFSTDSDFDNFIDLKRFIP